MKNYIKKIIYRVELSKTGLQCFIRSNVQILTKTVNHDIIKLVLFNNFLIKISESP